MNYHQSIITGAFNSAEEKHQFFALLNTFSFSAFKYMATVERPSRGSKTVPKYNRTENKKVFNGAKTYQFLALLNAFSFLALLNFDTIIIAIKKSSGSVKKLLVKIEFINDDF